MLLVSQNIGNYEINIPKDTVFRINMAWCNSISELKEKLEKNRNSSFFIDLPIGRIKPPNNRYTLDEMIPILNKNENVKFFAVSKETLGALSRFFSLLPSSIFSGFGPPPPSPTPYSDINSSSSTFSLNVSWAGIKNFVSSSLL